MPNLWGIPVTQKFAAALGQAENKQSKQQMSHAAPDNMSKTQQEAQDVFDKQKMLERAGKDAIEAVSIEDIVPDAVYNLTGSDLAAFVSSFVSPTSVVKGGAKGVSNIMSKKGKEQGFNIDVSIEDIVPDLQLLSPNKFLELAAPFGHQGGRTINRETVEYFKKHPEEIQDLLLTLKRNKNGLLQVGLHDGRHRAIAAKELGLTSIPVKIKLGQKLSREEPDLDIKTIQDIIPEFGDTPVKLNSAPIQKEVE